MSIDIPGKLMEIRGMLEARKKDDLKTVVENKKQKKVEKIGYVNAIVYIDRVINELENLD